MYHVRPQPVNSSRTELKFVSDRVLLNEIEESPLLDAYNAVLIDEARKRRELPSNSHGSISL